WGLRASRSGRADMDRRAVVLPTYAPVTYAYVTESCLSESLLMRRLADRDLLSELEPQAERYLERHLSMAEDWYPHDYVPWSQGRDFDVDPWTPDQPRLSGVARTAFYVNLLTEDNLPSYHREIHDMFGKKDSAWMNWVHRWTAE